MTTEQNPDEPPPLLERVRGTSPEAAQEIIRAEVTRLHHQRNTSNATHAYGQTTHLTHEITWLERLAASPKLLEEYLASANNRPKPGHRTSHRRE